MMEVREIGLQQAVAVIEKWLASNSDDDWEHQGGISLQSTDNPGWLFEIILNNRDLSVMEVAKSIGEGLDDEIQVFVFEEQQLVRIISDLGELDRAIQIAGTLLQQGELQGDHSKSHD